MEEEGLCTNEPKTAHNASSNDEVEKLSGTSQLSPLISDENKNKIHEVPIAICSDGMTGGHEQSEQDLINNNEEENFNQTGFENVQSDSVEAACSDRSELCNNIAHVKTDLPLSETEEIKNNWDSDMEGKFKTSSIETSEEKAVEFVDTSKALSTVLCEKNSDLDINYQQVDGKRLLQSLLDCIQGVTELSDVNLLPQYLHQIAEIYFHEEEFEKAIQFIQLEKLYHQTLLANLSAIQDHWELKWKTAMPNKDSEGRVLKALDTDKIEKLTEICASHCRPNVPVDKITALGQCFYDCLLISKGPDVHKKNDADSNSSYVNQPAALSTVQSAEYKPTPLEMTKGRTTEAAQSGIAVEKGCKIASTLCTAESSLEVQRETARAKGRVHPDNKAECLDSENTVTDKSCFQPDATAPCEDMLTAAKPIKTEGFSDEAEVVTNTTPFFHAGEIENLHHDLKSAGKTTEENWHKKLLKCNDTPVQIITEDQAVPKQGNHASQKHINSDSNDGLNKIMSKQDGNHCEGNTRINQTPKQSATDILNETGKECEQMEENIGTEVTNEGIHYDVEFNEYQMPEKITEIREEDYTMEATPDYAQDKIPFHLKDGIDELVMHLSENSLSLDELAKRIQIEENTPPEGLVSILKKRSLNQEILRVHQKSSKRRVRFQDPEDVLDQDEVSADSCLLLVLLCIITVFLSVGGTALYCTFGDLDSSVCRDFTAQMDFYYAQFQQSFEKAKHWLLFS
eukprot:gi/632961147/ref/XP_007896596.1/ PREDICTED: consortin [Callorhinchus milii]